MIGPKVNFLRHCFVQATFLSLVGLGVGCGSPKVDGQTSTPGPTRTDGEEPWRAHILNTLAVYEGTNHFRVISKLSDSRFLVRRKQDQEEQLISHVIDFEKGEVINGGVLMPWMDALVDKTLGIAYGTVEETNDVRNFIGVRISNGKITSSISTTRFDTKFALAPDGVLIGVDHDLKEYFIPGGKPRVLDQLDFSSVYYPLVDSTGERILVARWDLNSISIYNRESGKVEGTIGMPKNRALGRLLLYPLDRDRVIVQSRSPDGEIGIVDWKKRELTHHLSITANAGAIRTSPDGINFYIFENAKDGAYLDCFDAKTLKFKGYIRTDAYDLWFVGESGRFWLEDIDGLQLLDPAQVPWQQERPQHSAISFIPE